MQKTDGLLIGYRLTSTTSWDKFGHLLLLLVYALLRMSRTYLVPFWRQEKTPWLLVADESGFQFGPS